MTATLATLRASSHSTPTIAPALTVIPAKAGIQSGARYLSLAYWVPAFAGMTANARNGDINVDLLVMNWPLSP